MDKKDLQESYMQFHSLQQQSMKTQKQVEAIEEQNMELRVIDQGLSDLAETKEGTEILVPLSAGIFLKAELKDNKEVIVNVGSNVTVTKTMKEAQELIVNQGKELRKVQAQLIDDLTKMEVQLKMLEHTIMGAEKK